jgi:hypothetical protein
MYDSGRLLQTSLCSTMKSEDCIFEQKKDYVVLAHGTLLFQGHLLFLTKSLSANSIWLIFLRLEVICRHTDLLVLHVELRSLPKASVIGFWSTGTLS